MKNLNRIIEYGLYLLVFLLPWQTRWIFRAGEINNGYSEYLTMSLYVTDILLIVLLGLFLFYKLRNFSSASHISRYWYLIAGLELMVFVSVFAAPDKLLAFYFYARFLSGVGLFWLVTSAAYNRIKLIYAFLAGIFSQACLGVWQFLTQSSFAFKWLGLAAHNPGDLGASVVETLSGERWLRAYGGLDHPNMLGGLLAIGILLLIGLMLKNDSAKGEQHAINNFKRAHIYISCVLCAGLFFTFSRGAWAGLIVGIAVMLGLALVKKDYLAQKKILKIILIGSVLVFILFNIYSNLEMTRLSKNARLEIKSNTERVESLDSARDIIKSNWLLGAGAGNYTRELGIGNNELGVKKPAWSFQPVHNVFLLIWSEIGIFGLMFFVGLLVWTGYHILYTKKADSGANIYKIGLLSAMFVIFMVDHWLWSLHFGILLFWLIMGIMV